MQSTMQYAMRIMLLYDHIFNLIIMIAVDSRAGQKAVLFSPRVERSRLLKKQKIENRNPL